MRELTVNEVEKVSGGLTPGEVAVGIGLIGLGITIASTGGLAGIPIGILLGAGTFGEIGLGFGAAGFAGTGGFLIGDGLINQS